jgi:integrase
MATVYKPKRDKGRKGRPWQIQFADHQGNKRTTKGFTDRGLSETKANQLEMLVGKIKLGMARQEDLEAMLGRKKSSSLKQHLAAFEKALGRKENTEKYNNLTMSRIHLVIEGCKFKMLADINTDAVEEFLADYRARKNIGSRTFNHYVQAVDGFGNWLAHPKRKHLDSNPFAGIDRRNPRTDVRHQRRALTISEVCLLIKTARDSSYKAETYDGEIRARIYEMAYLTGLRKGELASLTPRSFDLDSAQPTLTVEAVASKHRKRDVLPVHPDLVHRVRQWTADMAEDQSIFPKLAVKQTHRMIKRDLEEAGIAYSTEEGYADFHALRHTYITQLLNNGVTLVEARDLARHGDMTMTLGYSHVGLDDHARAISKLPGIGPPAEGKPSEEQPPEQHSALRIACDRSSADGQLSALPGTKRVAASDNEERRNPLKTKGSGVDLQPLAPDSTKGQKATPTGLEPATSRSTV